MVGSDPDGAHAAAAQPEAEAAAIPRHFKAVGISLVLHPISPFVPTVHANYRYFECDGGATWWFGGGADLSPSYLFDEDAAHFHRLHAEACGRHDPAYYPRFKAWCDRYFYLPHRGESRGIGGIFFDRLADKPSADLLAFVTDCGRALLPAYLPIVERRLGRQASPSERRWQQERRGRYVEFNLLYDRGTTFGLRTGGRVESILMSLPHSAGWSYAPAPPLAGSPEAELLAVLQTPRDWVAV